jgi:Right handed beta helix region
MGAVSPWVPVSAAVLISACAASEHLDSGSEPAAEKLVISPAIDTLTPSEGATFSAVLRLPDGATEPDTVEWSTTGGTVDPSGHYLAPPEPGTYLVIAMDPNRSAVDTASAVVIAGPLSPTPPSGVHAGYYVAPGGTSANDGSAAHPWNLPTAFAGAGGRIKPGDTVWVRGGTYAVGQLASRLTGSSSAPIIVRQYPGERATVKGTLVIGGADTWYWGFEVANTNTTAVGVSGVDVHAPRTKLVNLTIHDATGNGVGVWGDAPNTEVVGCVLYNNGWYSPAGGGGYGHGIYAQSPVGATVTLRDNVIYDQFGWGIHAYAENGSLSGFRIEGNAIWNNGAPAGAVRPAVLVGGDPARAERVTVRGNMTYLTPGLPGYVASRSMELGWGSQNADLRFEDNVVSGADFPLKLNNWTTAIVQRNRFVSSPGGNALSLLGAHDGWTWAGNTWYQSPGAPSWFTAGLYLTWSEWKNSTGLGITDTATATLPSDPWVFVRPHPYEPGRGIVVIYNWSRAATVSVDLSTIALPGKTVEVRRAQQPFGIAVATTGDGIVTLPMSDVAPPAPLGGWNVGVPVTGPEFAVFLLSAKP